jgi:3-hydroxyisobutyrate dehydrogenase/2-hydroxy-3-oxopropionate reductase
MGGRIAGRLLDTGHDVVVWNRTPARAEPLVAAGATPAATPREAAGEIEAVITCVADPEALTGVVSGPDGVATGIGDGTLIEMSTVGPEAIRDVRGSLPASVGMLDAPVLGSLGEAESGTLLVFVGGPDELAARWEPLLSSLGTPIHVGPLGAGASAKLVANATLVTTMTALGELVALADRLGLPRDVTFRVLAATPLAAQAERRRPSIETGEYPLRFRLALGRKDAELVAAAARDAGVDARVLAAAAAWFAEAERAGLGNRDYSEVLRRIIGEA